MLRKDPFITGEYYHIYNRGIDKRTIFKLQGDYERFIMLLHIANSAEKTGLRLDDIINKQHKKFHEILLLKTGKSLVSIGAWCLMGNHFHLLIRQEVDGGITQFMRKLGTGYSMFFNIKYQRQGALFGGPFKSKLIGVDDNYMRHLFGYIHLNPLDIKFSGWEDDLKHLNQKRAKAFLESYRYSSYQDLLGEERVEGKIIQPEAFPEYFETTNSFKNFVENYLTVD